MIAWALDHSILFAFTGRDQPEGWLAHMPDGVTEIHLPPLEPGPSKDVVLGVVRQHGREIDESHLNWCVKVAEGNPYFLQELANQWVETGQQHKIPSSLTAVLNERIARIHGDALQVLQTCAVLEKNSTLEHIELILEYEANRMLRAINELANAGMLIVEAAEGEKNVAARFSARHDLLSNAALARLASPSLAFLHRRAGVILEREIDEPRSAAILWDCAKHWQLAGDTGRAFALARSCATHLMEVGLPNAAADAYERSLAYCSTLEERLEILIGQAHAYDRSSSWGQVSEVARRARSIMLELNPNHDSHDELELMALMAEWRMLRLEHILEKALTCLHALSATANHRVEAGTMALMLLDQFCVNDEMPKVYELVESLSQLSGVRTATRLRAMVVYHTVCGSLDTAVDAARAMVAEERTSGITGNLFRSLCNAAVSLRAAGLFEEAESCLHEALSVGKQHKTDLALPLAFHLLASMALERGQTDDAMRWYQALRSHPLTHNGMYSSLEMRALGARLELLRGRPLVARRLVRSKITALRQEPLIFRRTYQAALSVATEVACGDVPSDDLLDILEDAHLKSRRSTHQAFAAYALYVGLKAAGRERRGKKLLGEYLKCYRREPWPAPTHLLVTLENAGCDR
jgi:tetratricopeptide (TPR) repeat protein